MTEERRISFLELLTSKILLEARAHIGLSSDEPANIVRKTKDLKFGDFLLFIPSELRGQGVGFGRSGGDERDGREGSMSPEGSHGYFPGLEPSDPDLGSLPGLERSDSERDGWSIPGLDRTTSESSGERSTDRTNSKDSTDSTDHQQLLEEVIRLRAGQYLLRVRRESVFRRVLCDIRARGDSYGLTQDSPSVVTVLLNSTSSSSIEHSSRAGSRRSSDCSAAPSVSDVVRENGVTLNQLRLSLTSQHIEALLNANGMRTVLTDSDQNTLLDTVLHEALHASPLTSSHVQPVRGQEGSPNPLTSSHVQSARGQEGSPNPLTPLQGLYDELVRGDEPPYKRYQQTTETTEDDASSVQSEGRGEEGGGEREGGGGVKLNIRQLLDELISEQIIPLKTFHKGISSVTVCPGSSQFSQIYTLEKCRRGLETDQSTNESESCCKKSCDWMVVHVVNTRDEYSNEQVELAWRALVAEVRGSKQIRVLCGGVTVKDISMSAVQFIRLRYQQTRDAFLSKYGQHTIGWESTMKELVKAVVKFDLLSSVTRQEVKLDLSDVGGEISVRGHARGQMVGGMSGSVFVMYNSARLTTLFSKFNKSVAQGVYSVIPEAELIRYSCLRELDEWELLFCYLLPYEDLIRDCVTFSSSSAGAQQGATVHTHRVCQLLTDLAYKLSAYYCRTHVLAEPRPHLLAQMHSRLTLLLCVQQVMRNALQLLDISPLAQL